MPGHSLSKENDDAKVLECNLEYGGRVEVKSDDLNWRRKK